jgi:Xaa-Pro dipeptidase
MKPSRLRRFREHLTEDGLDGAVVRRPANVYYLSGYPARLDSPSFVVASPERAVLVAPGNAAAIAAELSPDLAGLGYRTPGNTLVQMPDIVEGSVGALAAALREAGLIGKRIGIESADVSARHAAVVSEAGAAVPLDEDLARMRRIKDADEIRQIQAAVAANDVGFRAAAEAIAEGVSELDVMDAVVAAMQRETGAGIDVLDPTNAFISGPRTLLAAAPATPRRLERADLMILDLNPYVGYYKGDTTRTFCVGEPTAEQRRVHDALVRGLEAAEAIARPGTSGRDVFAALVAPIVAAGYGSLPFHGGHAIGLEHTERPFIIPSEEMVLEEGMVFALEPGVYLPEIGGLRVEDNYVVTANGVEALSRFPREITRAGGR